MYAYATTALLLTFTLNLSTALITIAFVISLGLVLGHKLLWPLLERLLYPLAQWQIIRNRKLMGGVAVVCLANAFHLTGVIKSIMDVATK